jgi:Zn-dependent M16 (insulinase) family peptidase
VCGGINCYASVRATPDDEQQSKAIVVMSSKALTAKQADMTELLYDTFFNVRFDEDKRIRELLEQIAARQQSSVTGRGHSLAVSLASSGMSPTARLSHQFSGLQGIKTLKAMTRQLKDDKFMAALLDRMSRIHAQIIKAPRRFLLVAEEQHRDTLLATLEATWKQAPAVSDAIEPLQLTATREVVRELWTTNTQVHFCAKAYPTVPGGHPDHAALSVLGGLMRNAFLHRTIREQGGAYGAGADQDGGSASFRFFSYRDPRLAETLQDFDAAIDWVINEDHHERLVEEAILGVISSMDRSVSPAGAAKQDYYSTLFGRTREARMAFRKRVLAVTLADLKRVCAQYLKPENASIGVVSNTQQQAIADQLSLKVNAL